MTDHRPAQCRFRLRDEGKLYPRSSCTACGRSVLNGLGTRCAEEIAAHTATDRELLKQAMEALKAFSDFATGMPTAIPDEHPLTTGSSIARKQVSAGSFRRARAVHAAIAEALKEE